MSTKRQNKKPKEVVFTDRVIMTMATEIVTLSETTARLRAQFEALAAERGVHIPS